MLNVSSPEGLIHLRCCQLESHYEGGDWGEEWDAYSETEFFASWAKVHAAVYEPLGEHYTQLLYLHSDYSYKNHTLTNTDFKAFEELGAVLGLQHAQTRVPQSKTDHADGMLALCVQHRTLLGSASIQHLQRYRHHD